MNSYLKAVKQVALSMPTAPIQNGFMSDLWKALGDFAWHLSMLVVWLLSLATYPVSVFFFAGLVVYSDKKSAEAQRKADEEFISNMNRFGRNQ